MKKYTILYTALLTVAGGIILSGFKTTGAHESSTGAPGEQTCKQSGCHNDASVTNDVGTVNTLTFSSPDSSYVPGSTYTITIKAKKTGIVKMGFEIVALTTTGNNNAGTWSILDATATHTITGSGSLSSRKYVTHSSAGTTSPYVSSGTGTWKFAWKAPVTDQGKITFYYATNCTNNNGANTGDQLFLSNFTIHPSTGTSITEWLNEEDIIVATDNVSNNLLLNYNLKKECELAITLRDIQGKVVYNSTPQYRFAGMNNDKISLSNNIGSGVYIVTINIDDKNISKKVIL